MEKGTWEGGLRVRASVDQKARVRWYVKDVHERVYNAEY